jgi:NhaP-type Na+/H+ and K+/H+ antiporter
MVIRSLLRYLLNNEQLIQKIADSYPVRRAAQLTAYFIHKGKEIGDEKIEKLKESDIIGRIQDEATTSASKLQQKANTTLDRSNKFFNTFTETFKDEWKKAEMKIEEQKRLDEEAKRKGKG